MTHEHKLINKKLPIIVGMIYHERADPDYFYSFKSRAYVIDRELEKHNYKLVIYTPSNVDKKNKIVKGHVINNDKLVAVTLPVPRVNYDYHIRPTDSTEKQRVAYRDLEPWAIRQGYSIYPSREFRRLAGDKFYSSETISEFDEKLSPETQRYLAKAQQLANMIENRKMIFVKPRFGRIGDDIFVIMKKNSEYIKDHDPESRKRKKLEKEELEREELKREEVGRNKYNRKEAYIIEYYFNNTKTQNEVSSLDEAVDFIKKHAKADEFIVQEAVESVSYEETVFVVRTVVINDSDQQYYLSELYVGRKEAKVANAFQGSYYSNPEEFLPKVFGQERALLINENIENISKNIARYLNEKYNGDVIEVAFDILIDKNENLKIVEINVKPGLIAEPMEYTDFFNMTAKEKLNYEKYTARHGEYIAKAIIGKEQQGPVSYHQYWFNDLVSAIVIEPPLGEVITKALFQAIDKKDDKIVGLPNELEVDQDPRIVFLSLSDGVNKAQIILASGSGLIAALQSALTKVYQLKTTFKFKAIKLDIVQHVVCLPNFHFEQTLPFDRSLNGIAFDENVRIAFLPEELVCTTVVNQHQKLIKENLIKNAHLTSDQKSTLFEHSSFALTYFSVQAFYYSKTEFLPLFRGHALFKNITPDLLLESCLKAGEYLKDAVKVDGSFVYEFLPKRNKASGRYNVLRHAGTIYSMLELCELRDIKDLFTCSTSALVNLLNRAKVISYYKEQFLCVIEKGFVKLGANALTLLAISKYTTLTGDKAYIEKGIELARWLKRAQDNKGNFIIHKMNISTLKNTKFISEYYPGEAIFSLVRFYGIDPNPLWLEVALNAANYIINIRDKDKTIDKLEHDHWLLYGLNELYRLKPNPIYIKHTKRVCQAIMRYQYRQLEPLDYLGGYYHPPRSAPVATRAEGLCAAYRLLKDFDDDPDFLKQILQTLILCVRFQLQTQYRPERTMYFDSPKRSLGGFSRSLEDYSIRIDYVQHNISSLIAMYRILGGDR